MASIKRHLKSTLVAIGLLGLAQPSPVLRAQELKDELDALEDIPPDDLGASSSSAGKAKSASNAAKPAESAPAAETPPGAAAPVGETPSATAAAKPGDAAKDAQDTLDSLPTESPEKTAAADKQKDQKSPRDGDGLDELPNETPSDAESQGSLDALEDKGTGAGSDVGLEDELRSLDEKSAVPKTADATDPPAAALTGVESEPTGKVTALDFRQLADRVRLTIKGDRVLDWQRELRSKRRQVILDLKNMVISRGVLRRAIDTGEFDGPVALVQAFEAKAGSRPVVKVLLQLRQFVDPTVMKTGNDLVVDFPILTDTTLFKDKAAAQAVMPETFLSVTEGKFVAEGNKIDLNVKDADLQDVLNLISKASGKNFVLPGGTSAKVTLNVRKTPWDEALKIILLNAKLGYQKIGNVYRIMPASDLRSEIEAAATTAAKADELIPLETRLYALSYTQASDVATNAKDFLTKRGRSSVDQRTNTLVVTDVPETLEKLSRYIKSVDKQTPQIMIEGRIVEAKRTLSRTLGLNWSMRFRSPSLLTGSSLNIGSVPDAPSVVATMAPAGPWQSIKASLQALDTEGQVKTIASPRISVLDNQKALIAQGDSVRINVPGNATSPPTVTFVPVELRLEVTPKVTTDGFVVMNLKLQRDTTDLASQGNISTRRAETQAIVESGKTVVIGGIYTNDKDVSENGFPGLRNLPIFGALFRGVKSTNESSNELLMFISPKILNADRALMVNVDHDKEESEERSKPFSSSAAESVPDDLF